MPVLLRNTKSRNRVWVLLILLTGLCASQLLGIAVLNLFFTVCVGCYMVLTPSLEDAVLALFVSLPMFNLFNASIGSTSMYYLFVLAFWYKYFKAHRWDLSRAKLLVLLCFLTVRLTAGDLSSTAKWFVLFSVLVLTYRENCMAGQLDTIIKYTSVSFVIASLFGYLMLVTGRSIYMAGHIYNDGVTTIRFAGLIGDSVFFSQICALLVGANLTLGCYYRKYLGQGILLSAVISFFCTLSYAKTGLFLVIAEILVYAAWLLGKSVKKKAGLLYSLLFLTLFAVGAVVFGNYLLSGSASGVVQNYLIRFASSDLLTGRLKVWSHYIELMMGSWRTLFCAMPQSVYGASFLFYGGNSLNRAHNIYIESVCAFGFLVTLFILIWLAWIIVRSLRRHDGFLNLIPIGVILTSGMMLHGHFDFHYYFIVAIAVAFLSYRNMPAQMPPAAGRRFE